MNKSKTKKIIKRVMLLFATTIILVLCGKAFSEAASFITSGTIELGYSDLVGSSNLYCIANHASLKGGKKTYSVGVYRKIVGKDLYNEKGEKISTSNPNLNAEFAYILGGGNYASGYGSKNNYTIRQISVYNIFNSWANNANLSGWSWNYNGYYGKTSLTTEAENYAKNLSSSGVANVKSSIGDSIITSNTSAGPFKFDYTGTIKSIVVKDADGNTISNGIKFTTDKENKNEIKMNDIKSGQEFYIANTSGKKLGGMTVNVSAAGTLTAEVSLLRAGRNQKLMMVRTSTSESNDSTSIKIKTLGNLTLRKIDYDTKQDLSAGFKIKTSKGWLAGEKGSYTYDASLENATIYNSGKIEELDFDTYNIYEVKAPDGYDITAQEGYDEANKWVSVGDIRSSNKWWKCHNN